MDILDNITETELASYTFLELLENKILDKNMYGFVTTLSDMYISNIYEYILEVIASTGEKVKAVSIVDIGLQDLLAPFQPSSSLLKSILEYVMVKQISLELNIGDIEDRLDNKTVIIDYSEMYEDIVRGINIDGNDVRFFLDEDSTILWLKEFSEYVLRHLISTIGNKDANIIYCGISIRDTMGILVYDIKTVLP